MDTAQQIGKLLESDLSKLKEQDRLALLHASYRLSDAVEQPFEKVFRQIFVSGKTQERVAYLHPYTSDIKHIEHLRPHRAPSCC